MALSTRDKARGGVYTPEPITRFLAQWAVRSPEDRVLEPSAGNGAFLSALVNRYSQLGEARPTGNIYAVELDPDEAAAARLAAEHAVVKTGDFFGLDSTDFPQMTAVLGNPPYIRYQLFAGDARANGDARARAQGVPLSGLASSWAHFVIHACSFLRADGRLALVLPAELLSAHYAQAVWDFLAARFNAVSVIRFRDSAFKNVQVHAVLLLADDGEPPDQRVIELPSIDSLDALPADWRATTSPVPHRRSARILDEETETLYASLKLSDSYVAVATLANVDIGVVTGRNAYFIVTAARLREIGIPRRLTLPIVERVQDVKGLRVRKGEGRRLLRLTQEAAHHPAVAAYLTTDAGTDAKGSYKAGRREPWHLVPLPKRKPDALLPYMVHRSPRLIVANGHWSTNLAHGLNLEAGVSPEALAVAMMSSATQFSMEMEGRTYGGGVLKLEPSEAERVLVPALGTEISTRAAEIFDDVDRLIYAGRRQAAVNLVDETLGTGTDDIRNALTRLRRRRTGSGPADSGGKRREA